MIAVMQPNATNQDIDQVVAVLRHHNLKAQISKGEQRTVIGVIGTGFPPDLLETLEVLPGVDRVTRITRPYKLASRDFRPPDTVVVAGGVPVGGRDFVVMAGPCSVESRDQLATTARSVAAAGASFLRGGAFKPRTSPYSFQGLGADGLDLLLEEQPGERPADRDRGHGARPGRARRRAWPASSRSARATCRTSRCSVRWAAPARQFCSSAGSRPRSRSG